MKPKRIQLSRKKGWRKPEGAIVVARPSKWGTPNALSFYLEHGAEDEADARAMAVNDFRHALRSGDLPYTEKDVRRELRGKDLACWCPLDKACHADVLLDVANATPCVSHETGRCES